MSTGESDVLSRPQCLARLSDRSVGRVAISRQALPAILPVAYSLLGDDLVFGTQTGSGGMDELDRNVVAFEVDDIDAVTGAGWSVVVVGVARRFDWRHPDWEAALIVRRHPWALASAVNLFCLSTQRISGRRFRAGTAVSTPAAGAVDQG